MKAEFNVPLNGDKIIQSSSLRQDKVIQNSAAYINNVIMHHNDDKQHVKITLLLEHITLRTKSTNNKQQKLKENFYLHGPV